MIPIADVAAFRKEMKNAHVKALVVTYPGAKHSFTNPDADKYGQQFNMPLAYNAKADKDSWKKGMAFMAEAFK